MAATHGVYKRQNVRKASAEELERIDTRLPSVEKSTRRVDTTLSFAIKPVISAVENFQSPKPSGANKGEIKPAIVAKILSLES